MNEEPTNGAGPAQQEADAYRGDAPRPLGGYVIVMVAFAAFLCGAAGIAAAVGRRPPDRLPLSDLLLLTAGTHKLARTLTKDSVTSPLRSPFTRYADTGGPAEVTEEARRTSQLRHALGELVTCPFCIGLWIATGLTLGMLLAPRSTRLVTSTFAVLAGSDFLQLAYARLQQD